MGKNLFLYIFFVVDDISLSQHIANGSLWQSLTGLQGGSGVGLGLEKFWDGHMICV